MFQTKRLTLSIITENDKEHVFETLNNEHTANIIRFFTWPMTQDQAILWCNKAKIGINNKTEYFFIAKKKDKPVGCFGIHIDQENKHRAEIGYWVSQNQQNKGFATEMLQGGINFGQTNLNLKEFYATIAQNNEASEHILLKCGFIYKGDTEVITVDKKQRSSKIFIKDTDRH
ncbi:MAG: GNAT family N-acetyltransferase [Alphaproteobacteria bacterium]|nr:GNAT family N-acetyltransferase [Alphaproteobacteria bacterium]